MLKYIQKKKLLLLAGDMFLIYCAYLLSPIIRFQIFFFEPLEGLGGFSIILCIYLFCFYIADLYNLDVRVKAPRYIFNFFLANVFSAGLGLFMFFFFPFIGFGRGIFAITVLITLFFTYTWRIFFELVFAKFLKRKQTIIIVGAGKTGKEIYKVIKDDPTYKVLGFIDDNAERLEAPYYLKILGDYMALDKITNNERIDQIVIAIKDIKNKELFKKILNLKIRGVQVYDVPSFYEENLGKLHVEYLSDSWLMNIPIHGVRRNIYNTRIKRVIGTILSLIVLFITLPVILLTIIAIKMDSKGPVLFKQERIGLNGIPFEMVKFRTMKVGMEKDRTFAGKKDDPRITQVGRIIRFFRIDELPEFWNVLRGDMNIFGPRALMKEEVEEFEQKIPYFSLRHFVRPGITGWAQVNYPHGATVEDALEKLKYDLFYIKNLSPFLDFHIFLRTIRVVLFGKGAR